MNDITKHKFFVPAVSLLGLFFVVLVCNKIIVDKVADRVIQKLQKDYSPSPFAPGFDPDKIDINKIKR